MVMELEPVWAIREMMVIDGRLRIEAARAADESVQVVIVDENGRDE